MNPDVVPFDESAESHIDVLAQGKAVGPVSSVEWSVEEGDVTLTFVSEKHARNHWHENGGMLNRVETTSWVVAADWQKRVQR